MKNTTKKFIGGLVIGFIIGNISMFVIAANFIVNTFGYVN